MRSFRAIFVELIAVALLCSAASQVFAMDNVAPRKKAEPAAAAEMLKACPPIAFIKRANYGMRGTNGTMFAQRTGRGAEICVYDPAKPDQPARTVFKTENGFIFDMQPSYDGKKLVFSYKEDTNRPFHIWEIDVDNDAGKGDDGPRQLTDGNYHDVSPVYCADGRIVFTSSRVESFSLCQNFLACALHIIDADGSNMRRIDYTTLCTLTPFVMQDGSILCTRWEYQDKNIFGWEGLWTINPDGRQLKLYHGNTFRVPNAVYGAKQIPGTNRVLCVWAAHHQPPLGDIAMIDRTKGVEAFDSMWKVTGVTSLKKDLAAGKDWRKTGTGPGAADALFHRAFADPFPFSKDYSLVSFGGDDPKFHNLYVLNHNTGDTCLLYAAEDGSCFSAVPLSARPLPSKLPGQVPTQDGEGIFFVRDVYQGLLEQGVKRGQVARLRVMSQSPKKYNTEGPRYHDHYPIIGQGTYYVKINHGTVPVDKNGAAMFYAPSNTELYFQALDADGKEIQRMGSVVQITTGEACTCIGCHEDRLKPPPVNPKSYIRMRLPPDRLEPPACGEGPVDYVKQVQPVLDKYCIKCHSGATPEADIDLSGDKTRFYSISYQSLVFRGYVDYYYINRGPNGVFPAMATGSWVSRLTKLLEEKHGKLDVDVDDKSRRTIYAWIDANVPYYGTWEMSRPWSTGGRDLFCKTTPGTVDENGNFHRGRAERHPWVEPLMALAHQLKLPRIDQQINFTNPQFSSFLTSSLAKAAGGRAEEDKALFKSKDDPNYKAMLELLEQAKKSVEETPRIDMPGARAIPQERNFGRTY